jgi:predicted dehydrogenase
MLDFLQQAELQVVSVCDVNEGSDNYVEWGPNEIRDKVRALLGDDSWGRFVGGALAGLRPAQEIVQRYYALERNRATPYRGCSTYIDYRELLAKEPDLDAVIVCTPDHTHAVISIAALRAGKHVYGQKPMAHSVYEARQMAEVARETGLATQVATGNSASEATRQLTEWVAAGAIGPVREVHNWSSRPFWPQGIERPAEIQPVPEGLNWELWLGPAPARPFHAIYQPFVWRGWFDFGNGPIGDMGCYSFDTLFRVLHLEAPSKIEASSTRVFEETYPVASTLHFTFPARGDMPPVEVHWYDGGIRPQKPEELVEEEMPDEGMLLVGESGKIFCGFNGSEPRLIPQSAMEAFRPPPPSLQRSIGHDEEWIAACKGGAPAAAHFGFAGRVTEAILLGNVALRTGSPITWDPVGMRVMNHEKANDLLHRPYREGWSLVG